MLPLIVDQVIVDASSTGHLSLGYSQVARQRALIPLCVGSIPTSLSFFASVA